MVYVREYRTPTHETSNQVTSRDLENTSISDVRDFDYMKNIDYMPKINTLPLKMSYLTARSKVVSQITTRTTARRGDAPSCLMSESARNKSSYVNSKSLNPQRNKIEKF